MRNAMTWMVLVCLTAGCLSQVPAPSPTVPPNEGFGAMSGVGASNSSFGVLVHAPGGRVLPASAYPGEPPVMTQRFVAERPAWEPTIGINADGVAFFTSTHFDGPGDNLRTELMKSEDQGLSWTLVNPSVAGVDTIPVSLDQYVHLDPDTGRLFLIHTFLACMMLYMSDDEGETWTHNPNACSNQHVNDHETLFTGPPGLMPTATYPNMVYLCANGFAVPTIGCSRSVDGGRTFLPGTYVHVFPGENRFTPDAGCNTNPTGHGAASRAPDLTVYLGHGYCDLSTVHISRDQGATWEHVVVDDIQGNSPHYVDTHEGSVAVDAEGTAYYFWLNRDTQPYLSVSHDQGRTWGAPLHVGVPGLTAARLPSLTAGDAGRVAFQYMGTLFPDAENSSIEEMENATWNAYVGFSLNADADDPVFATTIVNAPGDPIYLGACDPYHTHEESLADLGQCGMRDFLDIQIDPTSGRVWTTIMDACVDGDCTLDPGGSAPIAKRGAVGVQVGGTTLVG